MHQCVICLGKFSVIHSHHTVPRSRGGENSLQIKLCSDCHNTLHANALFVISKIRNPKRPDKAFWKSEAIRQRAEHWLGILVKALATPDEHAAEATEYPVGAKLDLATFRQFKTLAKSLGCSQEKAVEYCVKQTLILRGFKSEKKSDVWFLPISKS